MTPTVSDSQLMAQVKLGSVEAFGELYDRFCDRAYRVAFAVCRDEGHAQDAVQDAFLSVWRSPVSYRPQQGTVAAWLLTGVRYRAIDVIRRNHNHAAHWAHSDHLSEHAALDDVSANVIHRDDTGRLLSSLAQLPERQKEVIMLAYFGQLSHTRIALQLGLPAGTVKGRMRLGLQKLRADAQRAA
jgi:RNA polymerase sigma-70 factor (ECF subfamily)